VKLLLAGLILLSCFSAAAQNNFPYGKFKVKNFSASEYSGNAQNWDIIQNDDHFFYFANNGGIIEFDGENWTKFEMENKEHPRSFDKDDSGRIYVGGRSEFGYIGYDDLGRTSYTKISAPVDSLGFTDVWKVYCMGEHIYFVTADHIFIHYQDQIDVIDVPDDERIRVSVSLDELLICTFERSEGDKSYVLRGTKFHEIHNSNAITPVSLFSDDGKIMIIDEMGFFHEFQQNGSQYQFVKLTDRQLDVGEGFKINTVALKGERIIVGTAGNGVAIFDMKGKLIRWFMEKDGLENLEIRMIYFDQYDNIWLCNDNGISFIETSSAITSFDKDFGITGITEDIYLKDGRIFLATHTDLFEDLYADNSMRFAKRNTFGMEVYQIKEFTFSDGKTIPMVIANDGLYYLDEKLQRVPIDDLWSWDLFQSTTNPDLVYVGLDGDGVGAIRYVDGTFVYEGKYTNTSGEVRSVVELDGKVYYSVKFEGVHVLDTTKQQSENLLKGLKPYSDESSNYEQFTLAIFKDRIYAGTANGLYEVQDGALVPSELVDGKFQEERLLVHRLFNDEDKRLWMVAFHNSDTPEEESEIGYFEEQNGEMVWTSAQHRPMTEDIIHTIKKSPDGIYWFGGSSRVYAYNSAYLSNYQMPFKATISRVSLNEDSAFCYHTHYAKPAEHIIEYGYNSVRFDFTTTAYLGGLNNTYSYYLEGSERGWGKWKDVSSAEYQRLSEGDYVFHVKAMNYYGVESSEATFSFTILPPWYRTIWAYIIYFVLFVLLIYIIIRLSIRRVKQQNERLEQIVEERTHEIALQNQKLEHQKEEIEEKTKDILDSIKYAKRIQNTILPSEEKLNHIFDHEHFVLYKPKDIVSGDFFWAARFDNKTVFSAIDCTGHGVPGAFVSIVGFNGLNRTVNEFKLRQPAAILDKLTEIVVQTFSQSDTSKSNIKDGMDLALCALDNATLKLEFAGANNPLIVVRNKEIIEIRGDKQPIGEFDDRVPFTNHEVQLQSGDCVYIFSDGYADQFGGPKGKKLKYKTLKDLFVEINGYSMKEQLRRMDEAFNNWRGSFEQLDDVCLIGIRIK
jgi:serine phosphatase RsbU (regulator of sigma subunit)